jgi:hypothetical protein
MPRGHAIVLPDRSRWDSVETILRRRGQLIASTGSLVDTLLPSWGMIPGLEQELDQLIQFRTFFERPSFRKLTRAITAAQGAPVAITALAAIAGKKTADYIKFLAWLGVVIQHGGHVQLARPIDNIGPTLEWYVADLCERDLHGSAAWSVHTSPTHPGPTWSIERVILLRRKAPAAHRLDVAGGVSAVLGVGGRGATRRQLAPRVVAGVTGRA